MEEGEGRWSVKENGGEGEKREGEEGEGEGREWFT